MRESCVERKLKTKIESLEGECWKWVSPGTAGVPDRICLLPGGKVIFVETKTTGKSLRALQKKRRERLQNLGFEVILVDREDQIDAICTSQVSRIRNEKNT